MRRAVMASWVAALLIAGLTGCSHGFSGDNCSSPIAATYTAQCNIYRKG